MLIGDSLQVPGPDLARRLVPPRALLWASLGRFDAWPPDGTKWCPRDLKRIGQPPAIQARILGALQAAVVRARLHVQIETVAYDASRTLDAPPRGLPHGIAVDFAPFDRSFAQPLSTACVMPPILSTSSMIDQAVSAMSCVSFSIM